VRRIFAGVIVGVIRSASKSPSLGHEADGFGWQHPKLHPSLVKPITASDVFAGDPIQRMYNEAFAAEKDAGC
jgi:hypothetical protein